MNKTGSFLRGFFLATMTPIVALIFAPWGDETFDSKIFLLGAAIGTVVWSGLYILIIYLVILFAG